jgi:hypothetical protein
MVRYQPMFARLLRMAQRELVEIFPKEQLPVWHSEGWFRNPEALYGDLERLQERPRTSSQSDLITQAQIVLLFMHRELWSLVRVNNVLQLTKKGLKHKTGRQRANEDKKSAIQIRNREVLRSFQEKQSRRRELSMNSIAKLLANDHAFHARLEQLGFAPLKYPETIRKIIRQRL